MHTVTRMLSDGVRAAASRWPIAAVAVVALLVGLGAGSPAAAQDCVALGGADGAECVIGGVVPVAKSGSFTLDKTLRFTPGGRLNVAAPGIEITITVGDFIMETNTLIDGNGANGAPIKVELLDGDIDLQTGSKIRSNGGAGGFIQLLTSASHTANIDGVVESIGTNSGTGQAGGGPITIVAGCKLTISDTGVVSSRGLDPGADLVHLEGCVVEVFGLVESTGSGHHVPDKPANSCSNALTDPNFPRRNPVTRPGKPLNSTGCVEIWAGTTLLIDSTGTALTGPRGEVNADIGFTGGPNGRGWIDLLANGNITITDGAGNDRDTVGSCSFHTTFAVHANGGLCQGTDDGGLILIQSYTGDVTASGDAIQADATSPGSKGGEIIVEALRNISFSGANVFARGDSDPTGGFGVGGKIGPTSPTDLSHLPLGPAPIRAFTGFLNWVTGIGDATPTGSLVPLAQRGEINLRACLAAGGVTLGASFPVNGAVVPPYPAVTEDAVCGGAPTKPAYATPFPSADCDTQCGLQPQGRKTGVKFRDDNQNGTQDAGEPGIIGWTIYVFNTGTLGLVQTVVTVAADPLAIPPTPDGFYSFNLDPGSYTVCEALPTTGWQQTAPLPGSVPPPVGETLALCAPFGTANGLTLGPRGYNFTILTTESFQDNNFGNFQPPQPPVCPEDPGRAAKITRVVDQTGASHGTVPVHLTVQAAYNAAVLSLLPNEVIGLFSQTTENVVLGGAKSLTITQCTLARISAAQSGPVMDITSTGKLTIIGPDTHGGTIGWRVGGNGGHTLKSIRADGATQYGVQVLSSSNVINWNSLDRNAVGLRVEAGSNSNALSGNSVSSNTGDGVQIAGNNNSLQGSKIESNSGNGVLISGTGNTIKSNKANKNTLAGFKTTATATGSKFGSNASNETTQNGTKENGGPEYDFAAGSAPVTNLGGNKADNVAIPTATKCTTLFSLGGTCN